MYHHSLILLILFYACARFTSSQRIKLRMSCNGINRSTMKETKRNKSKLAKATSIKGRNNCRITIKSNGQVGETWGANAVAYLLFGLVVAIGMGYVYSVHSKLLHENELWFSQISVSFTECECKFVYTQWHFST